MLWLGSNPGTGGRYTDEALAELGERSRRMSPDEIRDEALRRMGSRPVGWAVSGASLISCIGHGRPKPPSSP